MDKTEPSDAITPDTFRPRGWRASTVASQVRHRVRRALQAATAITALAMLAGLAPAAYGDAGGAGSHPVKPTAYIATSALTVVPINLATNTKGKPIKLTAPGGPQAMAISPNGRTVYVVSARGEMAPISTATNKAGRPFRTGFDATDMLITPNGKSAYVFEQRLGVVPMNLAKRTELRFIKIPGADAMAMAPNGKTVYVVAHRTVTRIRTATNTVVKPIRLKTGGYAPDLVIAPNGKTAYVVTVGLQPSAVTPINLETATALAPIRLPPAALSFPYGFVITPNNRTAYVGGEVGVTPINLRTNAVQKLIKLHSTGSGFGYDVGLSPNGSTLYAVSALGSTAVPISVATNTALKPIKVGRSGYLYGGMASPPYGKTMYFLNYHDTGKWNAITGLVTPVNTVTGKVAKAIELKGLAQQIVFAP